MALLRLLTLSSLPRGSEPQILPQVNLQAEGTGYLENKHPCYLKLPFMSLSLDMFRYRDIDQKYLVS